MVFWERYRIYKNNCKWGGLRLSLDIAEGKGGKSWKYSFMIGEGCIMNIAGSPPYLALYFEEASHITRDVKVSMLSSLLSLERK
jgi:hypothetical protein